jgi:hypothetical protein
MRISFGSDPESLPNAIDRYILFQFATLRFLNIQKINTQGDKVYAVVSGIAIGSYGRTDKAGVTVSSPRGQASTIVKDEGLSASNLVYAE